jgi:hypothetical protein
MADFDTACRLALALPEVTEGKWWGTAGLLVRKKGFARLREADVLVVQCGHELRDILMQSDPDTFFITDHYRGWPGVLIRLSQVPEDDLAEALEAAWRQVAPQKVVAEYDKGRG